MKEELIPLMKSKITNFLTLTNKDKKLLDELLVPSLNLERCNAIIDSLITLRLDKPSFLSFLCYQLFKVDEELSLKIEASLTNEEKKMVETFKLIKDINKITKSEEADDIRNMFLAISKDVRVVLIKLAGILYDISIMELPLDEDDKRFVAQVRDIHIPLSERLGLDYLKLGMDDNVIRLEYNDEYNALKETLDQRKQKNEEQLEITKRVIYIMLEELNIPGEIFTRQKHISSIFKKLHNKNLSFDQIYDLVAMRVIVQTVEECYAVLGRIHARYKPMPGRFKDYIANPKPNGYKSLHTTVIVENQHPMEIQIRTEAMHKENEFGAPAHWLYKENKNKKTEFDKRVSWFREMVDDAKDLSSEDFVEALKSDLYGGVIFVQTPKGRVIEFPDGATAIDFAYAIHSDIGNSCIGVKVNGTMRPITTVLKNGDIVEVITSPHTKGPSRDWLNFAKTNGARNKIRSFFKTELKEDNIKNGKVILEELVKARELDASKLFTEEYISKVLERYKMKSMEELYASMGSGSLTPAQVLGKFTALFNKDNAIKPKPQQVVNIKANKDGVLIDGDSGMLVRFAGCCNPIDGDEIIGYISRGKGVTIHRATCPNVKNLEDERIIKAQWSEKEDSSFLASIRIIADKQDGNLAKFTTVITNMKVTITGFEAREIGDSFHAVIAVKVKNKDELNKVITLISGIKGVREVKRSEGWK